VNNMTDIKRLGIIAGNGTFPLLVVREALRQGIPFTVAAIREEASPELEVLVSGQPGADLHWIGLGQLGKLLRVFKEAGVDKALLAGQVKHARIYAPGSPRGFGRLLQTVPDLKMIRMFMSLPTRNTEALILGVVHAIEEEGIQVVDSTLLLKHLLPQAGVLTRRPPDQGEQRDIDYGRSVAREIARLDLGQTVVVKDGAVVAVEAMEGTDETIRRAAKLVDGQRLTVVKVSRPKQDMRFDVPVIGLQTLAVLQECNVSALALDAGKTLILDYPAFLQSADQSHITVVAE